MMTRRPLVTLLRLLMMGGAVAVLAAGLAAMKRLQDQDAIGVVPMVIAASLFLAMVAMQSLSWRTLLDRASPSHRTPPLIVHQSFVVGWIARYLPGPSLSPFGKFLVCRKSEVPRANVAAAIVLEQSLQLLALLLVPLLTVWSAVGRGQAFALYFVAAIAAVALAAAARTKRVALFRPLAAWARALAGRWTEGVSPVSLVLPLLLLVSANLLACAAFFVVALSVVGWPASAVVQATFVMSAAGLAGFVVPFVPSGAGVRELVIVSLMAPQVGATDALTVAVIVRAISVVVDACLAIVVAVALAALGARRRFYVAGRRRAKARA